jgi:hypothetical protein
MPVRLRPRAAAAGAALLAAAPLAALALSGCGGADASDAPAAPAATQRTIPVAPPAMPVVIDAPTSGARVRARVVDDNLRARVRVTGFARAGEPVEVRAPCRASGCVERVVPLAGGQWATELRVLVERGRRSLPITAAYADTDTEGARARVRVRLKRLPTRAELEARAIRAQSDRSVPRDGSRDSSSGPLPGVRSGSGGEVLVVGDSLEVLTSPYLQRHLPGVKLTINAKGGYSSLQIYELFRDSFAPSQSVVVFDAGTNDNPNYPQILQGRLNAVAAAVGDRCLVVPTIHGLVVDGVTSRAKNRVVRAFAASRPGTQVPDWAGAIRQYPQLLQPDKLHPTPAGADYRAQLIAQGVQGCLLG